MNITAERIPDSQVLLSIEVDDETLGRGLERAYRRLVNRVNIPGFRRGKAPRAVVERRLGRDTLLQEAVELLVPQVYKEAVTQSGISPIRNPSIEVVHMEPLTIKATVAVEPEVQLGEYRQMREELPEVVVTEEDIDQALRELQEHHAEVVPVERPCQDGDLVIIDVYGTADGRVVIDDKGVGYQLDLAREERLPGFTAQLVGLVAGGGKEFQITFPEDHSEEALRGRPATLKVTVHEVKERRLPALDDEFAKVLGSYGSLETLRQDLRNSLTKQAETKVREALGERVLSDIVAMTKVEIPPPLADEELDSMLKRREEELKRLRLSPDQYLRLSQRGEDELRDELRPEAAKIVKTRLVLKELAKAESITVEDPEIEEEIERSSKSFGERAATLREFLSSPAGREGVAQALRNRKIRDRLVAIATSPPIEGLTGSEEAAAESATMVREAGRKRRRRTSSKISEVEHGE